MSRRTPTRAIPAAGWLWFACAACSASQAFAAGEVADGTISDLIFTSGFEYAAPTIGMVFSPDNVPAGTPSTLILTFYNTEAPVAATLTANLVDTLPAGLVIASPPNATTTCTSGTVSATAGSSTLTLGSGAQVPAANACTVAVAVASTTAAAYTNTIPAGALQTDHGASNAPTSAVLTVTPGSGCIPAQLLDDPGFETTDSGSLFNPSWAGTSTNFDVPFCSVNICGSFGGTAGPLSGIYWVLFGGANGQAEDSTIEQTVTIPSSSPRYLNFWLRIGAIGGHGANLVVSIDGTTIATYQEPASAEATYTQRSIDVSSYADDNIHTVHFHFNTGAGSPGANFSVDFVRLECSPGTVAAP